MHYTKYLSITLFALLSVFSSCEEEVEGLGEEKDKTKIIFINAAPNGSTDPLLAKREIAIYPSYNGVQFNNFPIKFPWSNGYKAFMPGSITITMDSARSIGNDPPGPAAKVAEVTLNTAADEYYSVYATNTVQNVEPVVLKDDLSLPTTGKAKIRIANFSPDAGPVDIVITAGLPQPLTLASNLGKNEVKEFFEVDPGRYTIQVFEAGTTTAIRPAKANFIIDANSCYTIWTAGFRTLPSPGNTFGGYGFDTRYHANRWSNPLVK